MFPMTFTLELEGFTVRDKRKINRYAKLAMRAAMYQWLLRFFKQHFMASAFRHYPGVFKKRRRRKGRGSRTPNVRSGRMKRMLERSFNVTGTVNLMKGTMTGPAYTDVAGKNQPDKAAEITVINRAEEQELAEFIAGHIATQMSTDKSRQKVVVKS